MAKVHILERGADDSLTLVIHFAAPTGNNQAPIPWSEACLASGRSGKTILPDGETRGYQITAAEKANVLSGSTIEIVAHLESGAGPSKIDDHVTEAIMQWIDEMKTALKQYG